MMALHAVDRRFRRRLLATEKDEQRACARCGPGRTARVALFLLFAALLASGSARVCGQEPEVEATQDRSRPIYQQRPFDLIIAKRDGKQYRILPLDWPVRKMPQTRAGSIKVRLEDDATEERAILWSEIDRLEFYEGLVLAEAERLTQAGQYDEAFRHYLFLQDSYPQLEGLDGSVQNFLFTNAAHFVTTQRYAEACSTLEELYRRNASYVSATGRDVASALSAVAGVILQQYLDAGDYRSTRQLLRRLARAYGDERLPAIAEARARLVAKASEKAAEVRQLLEQNQLQDAQVRSREMLGIWPELEGGLELARDAARRYPIVPVAVSQRASQFDPGSRDNWASRRSGRLLNRLLVEYAGQGPEGGRYTSPLGSLVRSDDLLQLSFQLRPTAGSPQNPATAYDIANRLLAMASPLSPAYLPAWADVAESVRADGATRADIALRRPHVVPESLLRVALASNEPPAPWAAAWCPYVLKEQTEQVSTYVVNPVFAGQSPTQPAEIRERYFEDTTEALDLLARGDILALDRVFPADAAQLMTVGRRDVVVRPYDTPTLHLLVPNLKNPFLDNTTFRRALVHAIPRRLILDRILSGRSLPGCQVLTGPVPAPRSGGDPLGYAYDTKLAEQPFDPGVATLLSSMARSQLEKLAEKKKQEPPVLNPLVLAHPEDKTAKFACAIIAEQLKVLQIPCELKQLPAGQTTDPSGAYDLLYVAVNVYEPVVDVQWLLGRHGLAGSTSPYIGLALRRASEASTWREVRDRLQELHQLAYSEVTVIPLWQIVEHYAYSTNLSGLSGQVVSLYQDVERWTIEPILPQD